MKQFFIKLGGSVLILLLGQLGGFAQDETDSSNGGKIKVKHKNFDEIIIRSKSDKDTKITVEVKDGKVTVNGKPVEDFEDDNLTVIKRKNSEGDLVEVWPQVNVSPFRGNGFNYSGDGNRIYYSAERAFLGVSSEPAPGGGAVISAITSGSGAEKAGLRKGDIIRKINDEPIEGPENLSERIQHSFKPQDKVRVLFKREGKEQTVTATLGKTHESYTRSFNMNMGTMPKIIKDLDLVAPEARVFSFTEGRPRLGIRAQDTEEGKGVKVLDVDEESPAEKAGIKQGDIITQFDGKEVNSAESLATAARELHGKYNFKVTLQRDGKTQDLEVKIPRKLKEADL